ncbi:MAG: RpiB/LacA/LacB family sugar-phosphate isomerase [Planctomycetes bacterium]|nr:RpiB/LacA/LacB family sugar-phosphate isomerase [Planctomycetota bacterium]
MNLIIASDYSGFPLKEAVRKHLEAAGHKVADVGQLEDTPDRKVHYIDAASNLAKQLQAGKFDRGILFCGTGAGVSIVANKFKGIYCIPVESMFTARQTAIINNSNVISMGAFVIGPENACKMVDAYLEQSFVKGLPQDRVDWLTTLFGKLKELEEQILK